MFISKKLSILLTIIVIIFAFVNYVYAQNKPFVIHLARETIAIGDEARDVAPSRPVWWPDPEDVKFTTNFDVPFSCNEAELRLEVLNVNSARDYIKINGAIIGALFPDASMAFAPSIVIIPPGVLNIGSNKLEIESDPGLKDDYDEFLIRNVEVVLYRPGDAKLPQTPSSAGSADPYSADSYVNLPSNMELVEGEEFSVTLISSSREGYVWQLLESGYDHKMLRLVSNNDRVYDNQGSLEQQFNFLALLSGETLLEFRKFYTSTGALATLNSQISKIKISKLIILTGVLKKLEFPVAELGTHQLLDDTGNIICALRNSNSDINLDDYVGLKVKIGGISDSFDPSYQSMGLVLTVKNISVMSK